MIPRFSPTLGYLNAAICANVVNFLGLSIFISAFLFQGRHDPADVAWFQSAYQFGWLCGLPLTGRLCKQGFSKRMIQAAMLIYLVTFTVLLVYRQLLAEHILVFGLVLGVAPSFFWTPCNDLMSRHCPAGDRQLFFSWQNFLVKCVSIAFPVFTGWLVWASGSYTALFVILTANSVLGVWASAHLPATEAKRAYRPAEVRTAIAKRPEVRRILLASFLAGISVFGFFHSLISVIYFNTTSSNLQLGILSSVVPLAELAILLILTRSPTATTRKLALGSCFLLVLTALATLPHPSERGLILFAISLSIAMPLNLIPFVVYSLKIFDIVPELVDLRPEYFSVREAIICAGRLLSAVAVILSCALWGSAVALSWMPICFLLFFIPTAILLQSPGRGLSWEHD